jgi:hypothetical protein
MELSELEDLMQYIRPTTSVTILCEVCQIPVGLWSDRESLKHLKDTLVDHFEDEHGEA